MNESKISVRYSKALFNLAKEKKILDEVKKDIEILLTICQIKEFDEFLSSPIIPISKKAIIFRGLFEGNVNKIVLDTLLLIVKNRRETLLKIISLDFMTLYRKELGIIKAELITADKISEENKKEIKEMLKKILKGKIDLSQKIDSEIIGGFILRIDDKQIDSSVKTQLKNFRKELTN